jgi:hypothetical protein
MQRSIKMSWQLFLKLPTNTNIWEDENPESQKLRFELEEIVMDISKLLAKIPKDYEPEVYWHD